MHARITTLTGLTEDLAAHIDVDYDVTCERGLWITQWRIDTRWHHIKEKSNEGNGTNNKSKCSTATDSFYNFVQCNC